MSPAFEGILRLIGGLGLFLYAISRFGDGVQKMAGERIRPILESHPQKPLKSVLTGVGIAAALQNNFLTFGMISSLVNAGLLGLLPALLIMLGVNLGMTVNAQILAINVGSSAFVLFFIGYLMYFYAKNRNYHYAGQVIFNLALMYLGLSVFHHAFLLISGDGQNFFRNLLINPWFCFIIGLSLAALLRSSNTVVILVQSLVGVEFNLTTTVFLYGLFAVVIGANVGTTFINMLLGMDRSQTTQRMNWLHLLFNFTTALLWLFFLPQAAGVVHQLTAQISESGKALMLIAFRWSPADNALTVQWFNLWQVAMTHTLFNLTVIIIWMPLVLWAARKGLPLLAESGKMGPSETSYLDRRALHSPALALILASHELNQMGAITQEMLKSGRLAFLKGQLHLIDTIDRNEAIVDDLQEQITFYLSALLSQNSLTEGQSRRLAGLLHIVSDIERVGDHANSIAKLAERKDRENLPFSELALNEIELFFSKAFDLYSKACQSLREENLEMARQVISRSDNIDKFEEELRQNHIHRLNQGKCWPGSGVIYVEMLSNLQRIAAHSANIAAVVTEEGEL